MNSELESAVDHVRDVDGVLNVIDKLELNLRGPDRRPDDELRGRALQRLSWDSQIPAGQIDVEVSHGHLTLTREVDQEFESERAYREVSQLTGVVGVTNGIKVKTLRPAEAWWRA
jgi:osmotically-inducible protein OsmY